MVFGVPDIDILKKIIDFEILCPWDKKMYLHFPDHFTKLFIDKKHMYVIVMVLR